MADTKMKNIAAVDLLEESSGLENVVVETMGGLKRLPVSQIKGSGGGAGFDLMGKKIAIVTVLTGGELVDWEDTALTPKGQPTFEDVFGSSENFNQANVYRTNCTVTDDGVDSVYVFYGFYSTTESSWLLCLPEASMNTEEFAKVASIKVGVQLVSSATFAELQEIKETRPITAIVRDDYSTKERPSHPVYIYSAIDYSVISSLVQEALPPEAQNKDLIILLMSTLSSEVEKDLGVILLVLFEDGTEETPVLGTVLLENFGG